MPDRTQEIKNLRAVATACKGYVDKVADNLRWELGTYDLGVDTNTDVAHIKTLPSGTIQTTVAKVEGVGYKVNQLAKTLSDVNWSTTNATATYSDGVATLTPTAQFGRINQYFNYEANHKLLITCDVKLSNATNSNDVTVSAYGIDNIVDGNITCQSTTDWQNVSVIIYSSSSSANNRFMVTDARTSDWGTIQIKNYMVFDLTADFGSGNEPTSVSDCATAYLQRSINIYEYAPQQSSIKNNAFTGVKVEGFNIWDEEWEVGSYNVNTGEKEIKYGKIRSKNYINVIPNTTYYFKVGNSNGLNVFFYDNNKQPIINNGTCYTERNGDGTITLPNNCYYINISTFGVNTTTYNHDICINISGSANGTYVPYIQPTTIPIDLTTIKDSNNVSLFPSGKMMGNSNVADFITPYNQESRWNEVDLGTLNWQYGGGIFYAEIVGAKPSASANVKGNILCGLYENVGRYFLANNMEMAIDTYAYVNIINNSYTTASAFKTAMSGVKLQYERATYLTSNTDLTSLTRINAQSNGTITLNNTDNVDMPNTIDYLIEEVKA